MSTNAKLLDEVRPGYFVVNGDMTFSTVSTLLKSSASLYRGRTEVDVDLANVNRADSAGLALLIEWVKMTEEKGVYLHFYNMPAQLTAIVEISQVQPLLKKFTSESATS